MCTINGMTFRVPPCMWNDWQVKGKNTLVHDFEACRWSRCIAPLILNIGARRSTERFGRFNPETHWIRRRVNLIASLDVSRKTVTFWPRWKSEIVMGGIDVKLTAMMWRWWQNDEVIAMLVPVFFSVYIPLFKHHNQNLQRRIKRASL